MLSYIGRLEFDDFTLPRSSAIVPSSSVAFCFG
jgi:hypothetical protein